jgi:hypothetical protein
MFSVAQQSVPQDALLRTYRRGNHADRWGGHADCFCVCVDRAVSLAEFVFAFYTSPVFRIERLILRAFLGAGSSEAQARALADGSAAAFAVWYVGDRTATQLLMCDRYERTRSWFGVLPLADGRTLLQFGSSVAVTRNRRGRGSSPGGKFRLLLRFHILYSQVLLHSARSGLMKIVFA